jgi:hypothetical protein
MREKAGKSVNGHTGGRDCGIPPFSFAPPRRASTADEKDGAPAALGRGGRTCWRGGRPAWGTSRLSPVFRPIIEKDDLPASVARRVNLLHPNSKNRGPSHPSHARSSRKDRDERGTAFQKLGSFFRADDRATCLLLQMGRYR